MLGEEGTSAPASSPSTQHPAPNTRPEIVVENLSYGPIAVVQRLEAEPRPFDRLVLVAAVRRGRPPGTVAVYRWDGALPPARVIQGCVAEAVTGIISLDNLLVIGRHFRALPDDVVVVEVEPLEEFFGDGFSAVVEGAVEAALAAVRREALAPPDGGVREQAPVALLSRRNGHGG